MAFRFISMAKGLHQIWLSPTLHRSIHNASNFREAPSHLGAHLRNSPYHFLQKRALVELRQPQFQPAVFNAEQLGGNMNRYNYRLELDQIRPPEAQKLTLDDCRRLLRLVRLQAFKTRLQQIHQDYISVNELLHFSVEHCSEEEAIAFIKLLDESGHILVLDHTVHLRPQKVVRALEEAMLPFLAPKANPLWEELARLEKDKAEIDGEARKRVKVELGSGLGLVAVQTAVLMRLTFCELSWDVMEPICFFLSSIYFMAGYGFFLGTSTNPTLEGIFKARFQACQKRLMEKRNFDAKRFTELQVLLEPRLNSMSS